MTIRTPWLLVPLMVFFTGCASQEQPGELTREAEQALARLSPTERGDAYQHHAVHLLRRAYNMRETFATRNALFEQAIQYYRKAIGAYEEAQARASERSEKERLEMVIETWHEQVITLQRERPLPEEEGADIMVEDAVGAEGEGA